MSAYYEADAQAARLYADFAAGSDGALDQSIPIDEQQSLHLSLRREADGSVTILAWETVTASIEEEDITTDRNLWGAD